MAGRGDGMVRSGSLILLTLLAFTPSCASYKESVQALESIHQEPAAGPEAPSTAGREPFMQYAPLVGDEEVDDPVDFCLSAVEELEEHDYEDSLERAPAVHVLGLAALRSPSMLVRARSLRALPKILRQEAAGYRPFPAMAAPEDYRANLERLHEILQDRIMPGTMAGEDWEDYRSRIRYFGFAGVNRAAWAMEALGGLSRAEPFGARDPALSAIHREVVEALNLQAFFLAALEGLMDRESVVRTEAIEGLFVFPWESVRGPLAEHLEYNRLLAAPEHRILIVRRLKALADRPETLGVKILGPVVQNLEYTHPGVLYHTVALLGQVTGIESDDPGIFKDWWEDYLPKHAGERP
jgi:hypothetical protein